MTEPLLPDLEAERDRLYARLAAVGDFRRGSVSQNYRKCGKPNCACAVNWPARSLIRNLAEAARWPRSIRKLRAA
jgi:hypothetical protein